MCVHSSCPHPCGQWHPQEKSYDGHSKGDNCLVSDDPVSANLIHDSSDQGLQQTELQTGTNTIHKASILYVYCVITAFNLRTIQIQVVNITLCLLMVTLIACSYFVFRGLNKSINQSNQSIFTHELKNVNRSGTLNITKSLGCDLSILTLIGHVI